MPIFVERFLLPAIAILLVAIAVYNPMGFDKTQRSTLALAIFCFAYFLAHTLYKQDHPQTPMVSSPQSQSQDGTEENRPFFTVDSPKLIMDQNENNKILDFKITNTGKRPANSMFGYSFIFQEKPIPVLIIHPQSWVNDFPYGQRSIFHTPVIKEIEPQGLKYAYLYIQYIDIFTKNKYSQSFYFEQTIYKNGFVEFSDAGSQHKKEIDQLIKVNLAFVDDLVKSGADQDTITAAFKKHGLEVHNVNEF